MCGLFGDASLIKVDEIKAVAEQISTKPSKCIVKDKVSFKFKEKGKAAINATGVC